MKTFSILLLVLTSIHAATTADVTSLMVAFILFCRECGGDVASMFNQFL